MIRIRALFLSILAAALVLSACAPAAQATPAPAENADVNLQAAAHALSDAAGQMQAAVQAWSPTREDDFTALAVMIPTMNEYFEQWKLSAFVHFLLG